MRHPSVLGGRGRGRDAGAVVGALLAMGAWLPVAAEPGPLPGSCTTHPTKVVNPGCVPALVEQVEGVPQEVAPAEHTYPDLAPDVTTVFLFRPPVWDPATGQFTAGPPELMFDTLSLNLGTVPLDLLADDPTGPEGSTVSQCVSWTADSVCRERRPVGGFVWHAEHNHFHFGDFALYQLRRLSADGSPDYSEAGLVAVSDKVSFCLLDSRRVAAHGSPAPRYLACNSANQGISAGWADHYTFDLPGQQFPLAGVTDGRYAVIVDMDTSNHVFETDDAHNRVEVTVEISGGVTQATIIGRHRP